MFRFYLSINYMDNIINQSIQNIEKSKKLVSKIETELKKGIKTNKNNRLKIEFKPTIKIEVYGNTASSKKKASSTKKKASSTKKKASSAKKKTSSTKKKTSSTKKKASSTKKKKTTKRKTVRNQLYNLFNPK